MSQPGPCNETAGARVFPAIFLLSAATLTYEIGLTRIFSISQGYHFAFMVISIALLGLGAGGAVQMLIDIRWKIEGGAWHFLSTLASLFSIFSVLSFLTANRILFDPVEAAWNRLEFLKILAQYLILSIPFIISGTILSASYRSMSDRIHRLYLADMAGAGTGCILILYILSKSGGEGAILVSALLALVSSLLFLSASHIKGKDLFLPVISKVILILAVLSSSQVLDVRMSPYRELSSILNFPGAGIVETIFSPSGRMDIVDSPAVRAAPGISLSHQSSLPPQLGFTINGGGLATVTDRKGDLSFLHHLPSSLPYRLKKGGDVFIINPGGGMEALSAVGNGAGEVWGSETSAIVLNAMNGILSDFSGGLYRDMSVKYGYARDILRTAGHTFDIIQVPMTDTLGSSSSGIRGLQEEYNMTIEAFHEYFKYVRKDGFISASIYLLPPPRLELKLLSTITAALEKTKDIKAGGEAKDRIIAIRSWGVLTILAKNGTITAQDIETVKEFCREERFDLVWYPGMLETEANIFNRFSEPVYHRLFRTILEGDRTRLLTEYIFDVRPATDDRPFFGQTFKMTRMKETYQNVGRKWGILIEGGYLLPWILVQSVLASLILIMAPLIFSRFFTLTFGKRMGGISLLTISTYFAAIGLGYMFLEISLMQRMIPVLGEPVYSISAVLFTLLLSSGLGSYFSGRFKTTDRNKIHSILIIPALAVLYLVLMGPATEKISTMPIYGRFVTTFLLFFPLGFVMGIPFPTGMSFLGKRLPDLIPWAWCINSSFSVVGSVLTVMIALSWGFSSVHLLAAGCYIVAWLALIPLLPFLSSAQTKLP